MKRLPAARALALLTTLAALLAAPAAGWAASTAASSASDSVSQSVGSLSTSIGKSSDSSSKKNDVADGDYRIIDVAAMPERAGHVRLTLQDAAGTAEPFHLYLPEAALQQAGLATGQTLTARNREYGVAFAKAGQPQPFFLVLQDAWYRELPSRPVVL